MIAQKGRPSLCRFWIPRRFPHPAQHGPFRNVEAKHLQFAMNPWRAPGWVLPNHAEDEFAEFNADALPAGTWMAREPGPIQLEAGPVPSHNGLRLNENQCLPPPGPEPPQNHPEKSVGNGNARMGTPPFQDSKLLPKSQILQEEIAARTKEHDHRNRQQLHQAQHARSCTRRQSRIGYAHRHDSTADRYFGERQVLRQLAEFSNRPESFGQPLALYSQLRFGLDLEQHEPVDTDLSSNFRRVNSQPRGIWSAPLVRHVERDAK